MQTSAPKAATGRFAVTPFGDRIRVTRIEAQKGDRVPNPITSDRFEEVTIAQGSGLDGFDVVRVYQDGSGYSVFSKRQDKNVKVAIILTPEEMSGLIQALNSDKIALIEGLYSSDLSDGTQGFIEIKTSEGRRYCWLNNYFDPVEHAFDFCNRVIWPKVENARIEKKGIGRQDEYYRVFQPLSSIERAPPVSRASGMRFGH